MKTANPKKFFTKEEEAAIVSAIKTAEKETSGEIRVHLERCVKGDILEKSIEIFDKIGMCSTKERNGCLIVLDLTNKKFAVIGDKGINDRVEKNFWGDIADIFSGHFKQNKFADGLSKGILKIGAKLKELFPHKPDDVNELSDAISKNSD
ncbi:MAG TPA: TPM domain-containing protein [bacterium]|nr:TPM domain-containing protein [bacterium]